MGLFQKKQMKKKTPAEEAVDAERHFFDEYLREELRGHAQRYFEDIIKENGTLFKTELQATVEQINTDLKEHIVTQLDTTITQVNFDIKQFVTGRLDEQFVEYGKAMKEAQDTVVQSLNTSAESLQKQHQQLSETLQNNAADQEKALNDVLHENTARMAAMRDAQDSALRTLSEGAKALQEQHQQLSETLEKNVAHQEKLLVTVFEENMAQIIEHYLLNALGDQQDIKAQLPSIIHQLELNKQAIVDDMSL